MKARTFVPLIWVAAAVAWWISARLALTEALQIADARAIQAASGLLHDRIDLLRSHLEREADLMAADPRIRVALANPEFDEATLSDLLGDFRKTLSAEMVVLVSSDARLMAASSYKSMAAANVGKAEVIGAAMQRENATSDVWGFGDRLLVVGASAIRIGGSVAAVVVIGASLGSEAMAPIVQLTHVAGAIAVRDQLVAASPEALRPALIEAAKLAPGAESMLRSDGVRFRARTEAIGQGVLSGVVVWIRESEAARSELFPLALLLWVPVAAAAGLAVITYLRSAKTART